MKNEIIKTRWRKTEGNRKENHMLKITKEKNETKRKKQRKEKTNEQLKKK